MNTTVTLNGIGSGMLIVATFCFAANEMPAGMAWFSMAAFCINASIFWNLFKK
jgi:hypothetical protein